MTAQDMPLSKVDKLRQDASQAAQVRAYQTHPDVVALRVERFRSQIDTLIWAGIVIGLGFTMVNVQQFAANGARTGSLPWWSAWLLDPMVSLVLIAVLRTEQVTARYQVDLGVWGRRTKVFAFAATYAMNTWASWQVLNPAGIVVHSVPPLLVYCAAEFGPTGRDRLTEAVMRAARMSTATVVHRTDTPAVTDGAMNGTAGAFTNTTTGDAVNSAPAVGGTVQDTPTAPVHERRAPARRPARKTTGKPTARRKLRADYLTDARRAWTPDVHVSPAWVREVTDCSRGMSSQIAADLKAELDAHPILTALSVPTDSDTSESEAAA